MTAWPLQKNCNTYFGNPRGANGGASAKWEGANLVVVPCPWVLRYDGKPVKGLRVHKKVADSLKRVLAAIWDRLDKSQAEIDRIGMSVYGGGYNYRLMRGGNSLSMHSWGCALDFDPARNGLGDTTPAMDRRVIEEFEREGWEWGGHWSRPDGMHFQAAWTRASPPRLKVVASTATPKPAAPKSKPVLVPSATKPASPTPAPKPPVALPAGVAVDRVENPRPEPKLVAGVDVQKDAVVVEVRTADDAAASPPIAAAEITDNRPVALTKEEIVETQIKLRALYPWVGMADGIWGSRTSGGMAAFQASKGLPVTGGADAASLALLAVAKPEPVSDARAALTPADVRKTSVPAWQAFKNKVGGLITFLISAILAIAKGISDYFGDATAALGPVREFFADVPGWLWFAAIAALAFAFWRNSAKGEAAAVEQVKSGETAGPAVPV